MHCLVPCCKVGDHVDVERLADGRIFDGHVVAVNIGDSNSTPTKYDVLYESGDRENLRVERHRIFRKSGRNAIFSVLPTTNKRLNQLDYAAVFNARPVVSDAPRGPSTRLPNIATGTPSEFLKTQDEIDEVLLHARQAAQ